MGQKCPKCGRFRRWTAKGWECRIPHGRIAREVGKFNRQQQEAARLVNQGLSIPTVARRVGVSRQRISRWFPEAFPAT